MTNTASIWITGLSASGKSTLARLFTERLRENGKACVLLDGDEIRSIFENKLGYDLASRRKQTSRVKNLVKLVSKSDVITVVAIIHPFDADRKMCRKEIPGYFEVFLSCDMKELIRRDKKKLYLPAIKGEKRHVIGVDIPFEEPTQPDLVLESDRCGPEELLEQLWRTYTPHGG
jgi:adenylyl-sulfate kinase